MRKHQQVLLSRRHARRTETRANLGGGCGALLGIVLAVALLAAALLWVSLTANLPSVERLPVLLEAGQGTLLQPTCLYDREGQAVLYTLENPGIPRRYLWLDPEKPDHFSPLLVQVEVFASDPTFWTHAGSTRASLFTSQPVTLTEQLVDRLLLEDDAPGWRRALRGKLLAAQVTRRYGRAQVLEWYLNSAGYGHLAYGADTAARLYLDKSASQLSLAEAALLVAVEQSPALNPLDAPEAALENQGRVLDRLLERGMVSETDYLAARAEQLPLRIADAPAPQPVEEFFRLVLADLAAQIGQERLERGGLRILTTLDLNLQQEVDCAARAQLARLSGGAAVARKDGQPCAAARLLPALPSTGAPLSTDILAGALVLDVTTGEVLAYSGSPGQLASQPGSLLTPFVALSGFARGMSPASLVWDIPESLPEPLAGSENPDGRFHGPQRLRTALANDYLAPFTHLLDQVGPSTVWRLADPLGLHGLDRAAEPGALLYRGGDVPPLGLAQAYAVFARLGQQTGEPDPNGGLKPVLVRAVQAVDGTLLQQAPRTQTVNVLAPELAYLVHTVLSDDIARRPSQGSANPLELERPSAGKLGQADDGRQVWAVGYTPQRLVLSWMGSPSSAGPRLKPLLAAGLWRAVIQTAVSGLPAVDWSLPPAVVSVDVCDPSGLLPTADCPNVVSEVFINGMEPQGFDTLYRGVRINRETGRLATVFTPPGLVDEQVFLVVPPEARAWAQRAGLPQPPEDYDAIQPAPALPGANILQPELFASVRGQVEITGSAAGDDFLTYRLQVGQGLNPQSWLPVGEEQSQPVEDGLLGVWDTTGLDGLWALRLQVERTENRLDTAVLQVTVDNTPPQVRVIYPARDALAQPSPQGTVTLQAEVTDNIAVSRVEWRIDGRPAGETFTSPYSLPWPAVRGPHTLTLLVTDTAGNLTETQPVPFQVP